MHMNQELDLVGQIALVTGAARGIGFAIAEALARRGVHLVVNDIDETGVETAVARLNTSGVEVIANVGDVTDPAAVEKMVAQAHTHFGCLNILVNNAGAGGRGESLVDTSLETWRHILDVDLTAVFLCCRAAVPAIIESGGGSIINISSVFGLAGAAGSVAYAAAKAGVIGLTKSLARELAAYEINVNAVAPGLIDTEMSRARGTIETMWPDVPWPRLGTPQDVAEVVAFLASPAAAYITGQVISPNGGSHL